MNDQSQSFLNEQKSAAELFDIEASDHEITQLLRNRIAKSEKFYDQDPAYLLTKTRKNNATMMYGDHYKAGSYPAMRGDSSVKYMEAQIYAAIQTVVSYCSSRLPEIEAKPYNENKGARMVANDFAKYAEAHGIEHDLMGKFERVLNDLMIKRVGVMKMVHDASYKGVGDIMPKHVDPSRIVFDHNCDQDGNPGFIAEKISSPLYEIIQRFPDKVDAILEHCGYKKGTTNQLATTKDYYEVWVTGVNEEYQPEEQLICFMGGLVLIKARNPHWLYDVEQEVISNHLPMPPKPYLSINLMNDGSNKIDQTSLIELVTPLQHALNRRKRSIAEAAERYAGIRVFSGDAVDKEAVEELSGDVDESLIVDAENVNNAVTKVAPDFVPEFVWRDALDIRNTIHSIIGTPPNFRGDTSDTETLGEAIMQRDQAAGRLEPLIRAIDTFFNRYYAMLLQFVKVYYTEEHWLAIAGEDGMFDYVMMSRDRLEDGIDIRVRGGTTPPLDENRLQNVAVKLASMNRISNIDLYRALNLPKPEKMVQNLVKEQVDPTLLVKDLRTDDGDRTAYMDFEVIKAGKFAPPREDIEPGHIDTHRQQMVSDEFQTLPLEIRQAFASHLNAEMESLKRRADAMSNELAAKEQANAEVNPPEPTPGVPSVTPPQAPPPAPPMPENVAPTPQNPAPMIQ